MSEVIDPALATAGKPCDFGSPLQASRKVWGLVRTYETAGRFNRSQRWQAEIQTDSAMGRQELAEIRE